MTEDPTVPGPQLVSTPTLLVLAVLAFAVELALFGGVGAIAYVALGGGVAGWLAALVATAAVVVMWGVLMAPRARHRLGTGPRLLVSAVLSVATAVGLVLAGLPLWGWFVGVAGVAGVAAQAVLPGADGVPQGPGTRAP